MMKFLHSTYWALLTTIVFCSQVLGEKEQGLFFIDSDGALVWNEPTGNGSFKRAEVNGTEAIKAIVGIRKESYAVVDAATPWKHFVSAAKKVVTASGRRQCRLRIKVLNASSEQFSSGEFYLDKQALNWEETDDSVEYTIQVSEKREISLVGVDLLENENAQEVLLDELQVSRQALMLTNLDDNPIRVAFSAPGDMPISEISPILFQFTENVPLAEEVIAFEISDKVEKKNRTPKKKIPMPVPVTF